MAGRPPINRELEAAQKKLARMQSGLLACYELAAEGQRRVEAQRRRVAILKAKDIQ